MRHANTMKKQTLVLALVALAAYAVQASEWRKICCLRVADRTAQVAAVTKLGQLVGNPMIGGVLAAKIPDSAFAKVLGPMRPGEAVAYPIFIRDDAIVGRTPEQICAEWLTSVEYAVLCPVANGRDAFVGNHPGCIETNGLLKVDDDYVGFSSDGAWAAMSDKAEQVRLALAAIPSLKTVDTRCVAELSFDPTDVMTLTEMLTDAAAIRNDRKAGAKLDVLKGIGAYRVGLAVGDRGIDFVYRMKTKKGGPLDQLGRQAFSSDPFADARDADVFVSSSTESVGFSVDHQALIGSMGTVSTKHGFDTQSFETTVTNGRLRLTVDVGRLAKYLSGPATNALAKLNGERLGKDIGTAIDENTSDVFRVTRDPRFFAFAVKGYRSSALPGIRFQKTIPEAIGKRPFVVAVMSLTGLLKAVVPSVVSALPEGQREFARILESLLPAEAEAGLAAMSWREDEDVCSLMRVSADELQAVGGAVSAFVGMAMMRAMEQEGTDVDDDD